MVKAYVGGCAVVSDATPGLGSDTQKNNPYATAKEGRVIFKKFWASIRAQMNKLANLFWEADPIAQMRYEYDMAVEQLKEGRKGLEIYRGLVERVTRQVRQGEQHLAKLKAQAKAYLQAGDRETAAKAGSYAISSYRRVSTPAYGGPDVDRQSVGVRSAEVSSDRRRVRLTLGPLKEGCVYEFQLKNLAPTSSLFHPSEAHYTLHKIPGR